MCFDNSLEMLRRLFECASTTLWGDKIYVEKEKKRRNKDIKEKK